MEQSYTNMSKKQIGMIMDEEDRLRDEKEANEVQSFMINKNLGDARFQYSKGIIDQLSTLQSSKTKEFFEIGKAAAIVQATMNTFEGATKALAQGGILGPIMAAAVVAAGMVQVQNISSQSLNYAQGGIVPGTSYSGDKVAANVNSGEMILNLSQQRQLWEQANGRQQNSSSNTSNVSNSVFNIQVNAISADEKTIMKSIDKAKKREKQKEQMVNSGRRL